MTKLEETLAAAIEAIDDAIIEQADSLKPSEHGVRERMTAHERKLEADVTESFSTLHALIYMLEETKKNRRMQPESCRTADA